MTRLSSLAFFASSSISVVRSPNVLIRSLSRAEENSMTLHFKTISVAKLLEFTDRNFNEGSSIQFAQDFINEIVDADQN
nr:brefeldin A-inhibited guanine nucleotide-exchange protein 1 [Ipomoea trifida]